jgi:hypothetical protein
MAPNLALSQHEQIRDMIISKFANATIARTVRCSTRSVQTMRSNLRCFGTTKAPPNGVGRRRTITPPMLSVELASLASFTVLPAPGSTTNLASPLSFIMVYYGSLWNAH